MTKRLVFIACLIAGAIPSWGAAGAKGEVDRLLRQTVDDVLVLIRDNRLARQEKKDRIMRVVTPVFDFELMGKLAIGRQHWPRLSAAQRSEYSDLFVKQLQNSYLDKVELVSDEKVVFEEPREKDGKISATTRVLTKADPIKLVYRFYKKGAAWRVYDLEIQDVSLVKSYGLQYQQLLDQGTVDDLLKKMKEKNEVLEKESQSKKGVQTPAP